MSSSPASIIEAFNIFAGREMPMKYVELRSEDGKQMLSSGFIPEGDSPIVQEMIEVAKSNGDVSFTLSGSKEPAAPHTVPKGAIGVVTLHLEKDNDGTVRIGKKIDFTPAP